MITQLIRYPVKSMGGESLTHATVTSRGFEGDRAWAVVDDESGFVASAKYPKKWGAMLMLSAQHSSAESVVVRFADGSEVRCDDGACADRLSRYLGRAIRLSDSPPPTAPIQRTDPVIDKDAALTVRVGPLASGVLGRRVPGPSFVDFAPIHLVTTTTLRHLAKLSPDSSFEPARFRPNLVIDMPDIQPFAENEWAGRHIKIGNDVVLRVVLPTPRCSVPTLAQPGLPRDLNIIRTVARQNRIAVDGSDPAPCVGAYAEVVCGGKVQLGDEVRCPSLH